MNTPALFRRFPLLVLLLACATSASALESVRVSPDGKSFVLAESGTPFRVWGVNYDHDSHGEHGRLLEDYWHDEWDAVVSDFREMKELGANSLDIVEVVSCSMRELKVKVPRAELNKLTNIDELVDLLHRSVNEKAAAAAN